MKKINRGKELPGSGMAELDGESEDDLGELAHVVEGEFGDVGCVLGGVDALVGLGKGGLDQERGRESVLGEACMVCQGSTGG